MANRFGIANDSQWGCRFDLAGRRTRLFHLIFDFNAEGVLQFTMGLSHMAKQIAICAFVGVRKLKLGHYKFQSAPIHKIRPLSVAWA